MKEKKKPQKPVLFTMVFPVIKNENGEEEILFNKLTNSAYEALGEILHVFTSMSAAVYYFKNLQDTLGYPFERAYYVQAFYTEVLALAVHTGTPSGAFCFAKDKNFNISGGIIKEVVFPEFYGLDIDKLDVEENSKRILNYLQKPKKFETFIKETTRNIPEDELVDEVYRRTNEYISHYVALMDDVRLLSKYKEEFSEYFKHGQYNKLLNVINKFETFLTELEYPLEMLSGTEGVGDELYRIYTNAKTYNITLEPHLKNDDNYYKIAAADATGKVLLKDKGLEEFDEDDLIDLAYMFKTNFPDEYIEMLIDFFAEYALRKVLKFR